MAATNKCLAQSNKSRTGPEATKRHENRTAASRPPHSSWVLAYPQIRGMEPVDNAVDISLQRRREHPMPTSKEMVALKLRDMALKLVDTRPRDLAIEGSDQAPAQRGCTIGRLRVLSYDPFARHSFHGINVWVLERAARPTGKVLNIEWMGNHVELRTFKRGDWERELEAHAQDRLQ